MVAIVILGVLLLCLVAAGALVGSVLWSLWKSL
jgi:hypothetical protein